MTNFSKIPSKDNIEFFEDAVSRHTVVSSVEKISDYYYKVNRIGKTSLKVLVTNIYIVDVTDAYELMKKYGDFDCIITISSWNGYEPDAEDILKENNVGLFKFNEFMGALNYEGKKFLDYIIPEKDD